MEDFMKRKIVGVVYLVTVLFAFIGCSNPTSSDDYTTYKVEVGVISNSTYNTAMNKISAIYEPSYSAVSSIRTYLMNNRISDHAIQMDVTLDEVREFYLSKGFSSYEVKNEIEFLESIGNDIAFFEHATDSNKKVWMYVTK